MYIETSFHYVDHILEYYIWDNFQKPYKLKPSRYNKFMLTCTNTCDVQTHEKKDSKSNSC